MQRYDASRVFTRYAAAERRLMMLDYAAAADMP